jgi:hypothetical protein
VKGVHNKIAPAQHIGHIDLEEAPLWALKDAGYWSDDERGFDGDREETT